MNAIPLSVQLYTLRELTQNDFAGTLQQVAKIGLSAVELAGYGNLKSASEAKRALDDAGLKVSGAHVGLDVLERELDRVLDEAELLGNRYIICPWMPEERRKDA